jgi:hypothetical protein
MSQHRQQGESAKDSPAPHGPRHAAPEGAGPDPLVDLSRDPTPGVPDHAAPEDDD